MSFRSFQRFLGLAKPTALPPVAYAGWDLTRRFAVIYDHPGGKNAALEAILNVLKQSGKDVLALGLAENKKMLPEEAQKGLCLKKDWFRQKDLPATREFRAFQPEVVIHLASGGEWLLKPLNNPGLIIGFSKNPWCHLELGDPETLAPADLANHLVRSLQFINAQKQAI